MTRTFTGEDGTSTDIPVRNVPGPRWFPEGHPARRLHGDPAALVGELSALLLRVLDPRCAAIVAGSDFGADPWGAVMSSARHHHVIVNGPIDDGALLIAREYDRHSAQVGYDETGSYYWGADREILAWIHQSHLWAVLGANRSHSRRPLAHGEAEAAVADWAPVARLAGVSDPATTLVELNSYMRARVGRLRRTEQSTAVARALLAETDDELALLARAAFALLPSRVRRHYGSECMAAASTADSVRLSEAGRGPGGWDVPSPIAPPTATYLAARHA